MTDVPSPWVNLPEPKPKTAYGAPVVFDTATYSARDSFEAARAFFDGVCELRRLGASNELYHARNETWRVGDFVATRGTHGPSFIALDRGALRKDMCTLWFFASGRYTHIGETTMHRLDNRRVISSASMDGASVEGFDFLSLEAPRDLPGLERLRDGAFRSLNTDCGDGLVLINLLRSVFDTLSAGAIEGIKALEAQIADAFAIAAKGSDVLQDRDYAVVRAARLQAMHQFLEARLHDTNVSAEELSAEFNISRSQVFRLFEPEGGVASALTKRRMNRAAQTLAQAKPERGIVAKVAEANGYREQSHFNRAFRRHFGFRPSDILGAARPHSASVGENDQTSGSPNRLAKMYQ